MTKSQKAALKLHLSPVPADGVCTVFCLARLTGRTLKGDFSKSYRERSHGVLYHYTVCERFCKQSIAQNIRDFAVRFCLR